MSQAAFVLHGHFYQPPRENPWTGVVPLQRSAAPFHDWNERVTAEAYRPNGWARVLDDEGRVVSIVNNYEHLSFNVGPTLLSWLEQHDPRVYRRVLDADARSGRAIAQAYSHLIMPLADDRDLRTQVRWGLADFRHRYGRDSAGMWLPETAVNDRVLAVLAEEGVRFTILAPGQAAAVAPIDDTDATDVWSDVDADTLDVSLPYRWEHPSDPSLGVDIVFYDGTLSHQLAFTAMTSQQMLDHVAHVGDGLVCGATDGETFGHHQKFTERAVAYAATVGAGHRNIEMPRLVDWIDAHPPRHRVEVRESAWSCAHGVGRWKENCGCHTGGEPGWNQRWRRPLRAALDLLRDHGKEVFERRGSEVFAGDPWEARDAYIGVVLDPVRREDFVDTHVSGDPVTALTLLEAQRHTMLSYTSCGWFFNDLAGIETVQVLRYAARAMDLLAELGEPAPVDDFLEVLAEARSNRDAEGDGATIWRNRVAPSRVDAERIVAHVALVELLESQADRTEHAGHRIELDSHSVLERGGLALGTGIARLQHLATGRRSEHVYAALHLGGFEIHGATRPAVRGDEKAVEALGEAFLGGERVPALLGRIVETFGPREFGLESALPGEAAEIVERRASAVVERFSVLSEHLAEDHRTTLGALRVAGYPLPEVLRLPLELAISRRLAHHLGEVTAGRLTALDDVAARVTEAEEAGIDLDVPVLADLVGHAVDALVASAVATARDDADRLDIGVAGAHDEQLVEVVDAVRTLLDLPVAADLTRAQERIFDEVAAGRASPVLADLAIRLGLAPSVVT